MNLAVNARDAMPAGRHADDRDRERRARRALRPTHSRVTPGAYVALTVTDTGIGMTPEVTGAHLRAVLHDQGASAKAPGSAWRRSTASSAERRQRQRLQRGRHGHDVQGLPTAVRRDGQDDREPATGGRRRPAPRRCSLVEDAEALRGLTMRLLERQGYTVLAAANATEARTPVRMEPVDRGTADRRGHAGNQRAGAGAATAARRPGFKVIYMSGYTDEAIVQHGVLKPGIAFLHKPFTSQMLGRKIREVLDQ